MPLTLEQIQEYLIKASQQATQSSGDATKKSLGQKALDEIYAQTDAIQSMINGLLGKAGVITKEEIDKLDEELRIQKEKILEYESKKTKSKIVTFSILAFATVGFLWYITRQKK